MQDKCLGSHSLDAAKYESEVALAQEWTFGRPARQKAYDANKRAFAAEFKNRYNIAYAKGLELFGSLRELWANPSPTGRRTAFLNAEAPGGFVAALTTLDGDADWLASSLRQTRSSPRGKDALGDRYGLIAEHPERWLQVSVPGFSGDVEDSSFEEVLAERAAAITGGEGFSLTTSDLGAPVGCEYKSQEQQHLRAHLRAAEIAIKAAAVDGSSVLKGYSFTSASWESLPLAKWFRSVSYAKPLASNPCNREVYLVLQGKRKGLDEKEVTEAFARAAEVGDEPRSDVPAGLRAIWRETVRSIRLWGSMHLPAEYFQLTYKRRYDRLVEKNEKRIKGK
jgi:hypothetical protein